MTDRQHCSDTPFTWVANPSGDRYIAALTAQSFETSDAATLFKKSFGDSLFQKNTLYIITGSDSGLLPRYIINHGIPQGSRYIFVELPEISPLLTSMIPDDLANSIVISDEDNWEGYARKMGLPQYAYSDKIIPITSLSAQQNSHPDYANLKLTCSRQLSHLQWQYSSQFDEMLFSKVQLENLAENQTPAILLKDSLKGHTAIVLAGGPSLDLLLPWVMEHRQEVVVIAVSRISARLIQSGVTPDIVVAVDPQLISFTVSKEMFDFNDKTIFFHTNSASPLLTGQWPHRSLYSGNQLPWTKDKPANLENTGPTVTNSAINLAMELGCSQIILAGVDLCYSAEGYTHSSGTKEHAAGPMHGPIDHTVETNGGNKANTSSSYYGAIKIIEEQAATAAERHCKIINPAAGAVKMAGIEYLPTEQITITKPLTTSATTVFDSILDADSSTKRAAHYRTSLAQLDKALKACREIRSLAAEALECSQKMAKLINTGRYTVLNKRLESIEQTFDRRYGPLSDTIKNLNSAGFRMVITASSGEELTPEEIFEKTALYYQSYVDGATELIALIQECRSRLLSRIEEESPSPNVELMLQQWSRDLQLGRGKLWKQRHPELYASLPAEIKEQFSEQEARFKELIDNTDAKLTKFFADYSRNAETIASVINSAISDFERNDLEALKRIAQGVDKRNEPLYQRVKLLINGFIHELEQDYDAAKKCYYAVDKTIRIEVHQIALEHIFNLSMKLEDYSEALKALKLLSEIIEGYQPMYAQLLALTGSLIEAIDTYTVYLEKQPLDLDTMQALGLLLVQAGAREAAQSSLQHIRDINPSHPGIKVLEAAINQ